MLAVQSFLHRPYVIAWDSAARSPISALEQVLQHCTFTFDPTVFTACASLYVPLPNKQDFECS